MNVHAKFGVASSHSLWDLGTQKRNRQIDGHGYIDSAVDAEQEYIYFMGSAMPPSSCYAHSHKRNRPFFTFLKYRVQKLFKNTQVLKFKKKTALVK